MFNRLAANCVTRLIHFRQLWRLVTTFLFFGPFGFTFMFNLIFTYRYCRMLEEGSFRSRPADFFYMFLFGATLMVVRISESHVDHEQDAL